jgi:hypothetical protein
MEEKFSTEPATNLHLAEPHFDDEATLLSARPVVPLREVEKSSRARKNLIYGLTITLAVLAGAFGATVVYRQRTQSQQTATTTTATFAPVSAAAQATAGADGEDGAATAQPAVVESAKPPHQTRIARADATGLDANLTGPPASDRAGETETPQADARERRELKAMRRAEQLHRIRAGERELRREARGERPAVRDLLRIREIFEGSPRP